METKRPTQIACFQWLRVFAAAAVVLMHTAATRWVAIPHTSAEWRALTFWDALVRWPVPVFVMITGAIFLPRRTELKTVLRRYIPRMLLAYGIWSGIYALYGLGEGIGWSEVLRRFAAGHYHLWYLTFLCGIYLVLPFVQQIAENGPLTRQLLVVSCLVGLELPWLADLAALLLPGAGDVIRSVENHLNFSFFMDHLALLLLGHWLYRTELSPRARHLLYGAGVLGALLAAPAAIWASCLDGFQNSVFFDLAAPNHLCAAAALFVFAKYSLRSLPKLVDRLAKWSFGIYLVHPLILALLEDWGLDVLRFGPGWWTPVLAALVFALSAAVTAVLARVPVVGKYLV